MESKPWKLGILVFDDVEVLDYAGPFEVFSVTGSLYPETFSRVVLIGEKRTVLTRGNQCIIADYLIEDGELPDLDILLIPGGFGIYEVVKQEKVLNWIRHIGPKMKFIITVCTGAAAAGESALLDGLVITTHHTQYKEVGKHCPNSFMCKCRRYIDNGNIYHSAGVSAGIDVSLYFVQKHFGPEITEATAKFMEYDWSKKHPGLCVCGAEQEFLQKQQSNKDCDSSFKWIN